MSGFNRLSLGWRLIVVLGLLAGLGQLGWATFGGPGLVSPFGMAGLATLVATLALGLLAWNDATRRALDGLARSVDALGAGQYDRPLGSPATDDPQVLGLAKGLDGVQRKLQDLSLIRSQNCDNGQGFLFTRPLSAQDADSFFRQWPATRHFEVRH